MIWLLKHHRIELITVLLAVESIAQSQKPRQLLEPEDRDISITGTIRLVHDFGPPGFGEDPKHDSHVSYWALETPIPVNTPCIPEKTEFAGDCSAAKRMKLFFQGQELEASSKLPAARWRDKQVVVHGKVHRADTAGEMTVIYLDVSNITAASPAATQH